MSKKTVFISRFLVQGLELGAVFDAIMLVGIEKASNGHRQTFYRLRGCLARGVGIRERLDELAFEQHRTKQSACLGFVVAAAETFPRAGNYVVGVESKHLLGAG